MEPDSPFHADEETCCVEGKKYFFVVIYLMKTTLSRVPILRVLLLKMMEGVRVNYSVVRVPSQSMMIVII